MEIEKATFVPPPTGSQRDHGEKSVHFSDNIEVPVSLLSLKQQHGHHHGKSRRRARNSSSGSKDGEEDTPPSTPLSAVTAPSKLRKLAEKDRHVSKSGKGRGKPKKGGAGGKGTWGKVTDIYDEDGAVKDSRDPNYDSDEADDDTYIDSPTPPQMKVDEFHRHAEALFKEYFDNDDKEEVLVTLKELNIKNIKPEIIRCVVALAMENKQYNCEMASQLISYLCGQVINSREISTGFDLLLQQLNDLSLDSPNACDILGSFIARAVADDCLPPAYVQNHHTTSDPFVLKTLKRAKVLLGMRHSHAKLENIWGVSGGQQPLPQLIEKVILMLKEYLSCDDKDEVVRCLQELSVPHFHHEFVYEATLLVLEDGGDVCARRISDLLQHLAKATLITCDQFQQGFMRIFNDMTEIVLDIPQAYITLSKFIEMGQRAGFVSFAVAQELPQRGRKRFISEGDGGAFKHPEY